MSLTEAESQAAAELANSIVGDFAKKGGYEHVPVVAEAAAAVQQPVAAAPVVPSTPAPAAAAAEPAAPAAPVETPAAAEVVPSFEPEIPEDLQELLDTPDFEAEAAAEVEAEAAQGDDEYFDTDQAKKSRALEKRNEWLEKQLVERSRKNWVAENLRAYPLLRDYAKDEVEAIQATSRRAFAREAAALNGRLETIAKPMLADIASHLAALKGTAVVAAQQEVKAAWGSPAGDLAGTGNAAEQAAKLAAAEKTGDLKQVFKVMLEDKPLV